METLHCLTDFGYVTKLNEGLEEKEEGQQQRHDNVITSSNKMARRRLLHLQSMQTER